MCWQLNHENHPLLPRGLLTMKTKQEKALLRLIKKWRKQAREAAADLSGALDASSRARLATEDRVLYRCARQLEETFAR
jgi:hypothetical protein